MIDYAGVADLLISFKINFKNYEINSSPEGPLMHRWLPDGKSDAITVPLGNNDFELKVWFERTGYMRGNEVIFDYTKTEVDVAQIPRQGVLDAGPMYGEISIKNMVSEQYDAIVQNKIGDENYIRFAKNILEILLPNLNKFIYILKFNYGQYWLNEKKKPNTEYVSLGQYFHGLFFKWSSDEGITWNDFQPNEKRISITLLCHFNLNYIINIYLKMNGKILDTKLPLIMRFLFLYSMLHNVGDF